MLAGAAHARLLQWHTPEQESGLQAHMDRLALGSRQAYEALIKAEGFLAFFRHATPIDVIESSRIGSRPAAAPASPAWPTCAPSRGCLAGARPASIFPAGTALRRWRAERQAGSKQAEALVLDLLVTVNAIAGGLGTTG